MNFVYKADPARGAQWATLFAERAPEIVFHQWPFTGDPATVRYLAAWEAPENVGERFPNVELVFSTGAGIDQFQIDRVPPQVPVVRMIESGLVAGVVEYATLAVLSVHRDWLRYADAQRRAAWEPIRVRPAAARRIGVLGMGVMGQAVLRSLHGFGFPCAGWSRSQYRLPGVDCFAGEDGLAAMLARSDILLCLLPLTEATRGILSRSLFGQLPPGAVLINIGRGGHLVDDDLLEALDSGQLSSAILDVFNTEPLPADHPFWHHPRIMLTPHVASMTQPETAVEAVLENIRRHREGRPLIGLIDRQRGY